MWRCEGMLSCPVCRSFDVIANEPGGKTDFRALLANLKKDCDYSLGVTDPAQKPSSSSE